jgi:HK97 family phage prohead protease
MSTLPADVEVRTFAEVRVDLSTDRKIRGLAIVFNKPSVDLGGFVEIIEPEAIDRTFREGIDVRALVDHETAKVMGRLTAGTLMMKKTTKGLAIEIDPPDTSFSRDIMVSMDRGDVDGMSFAFRVMPEGVEWDDDTHPPTRTITDMRFSEVSIVTFPAYPQTDVQVAKRSLDAFRAEHRGAHSVDWWRKWHRTQLAR